jgi:adenine-specific DNA-methyltransferase
LCNEVFFEDNFIATFMWKRKKEISSDSKNVAIQGEYVLAYGKTAQSSIAPEPLSTDYVASSYSDATAEFPAGKWRPVPITVSKGLRGGGYEYEVTTPTGVVHKRIFAYPQKRFDELQKMGRIYFGKSGEGLPQRVIYAHESEGQPVSNFWSDVATNKEGKKEILDLFKENVFDTPKPTRLIRKMLALASGPDDTVLDFFAGSGTVAHAVMLANAEDGGSRRVISVQLPEPVADGSEAAKAGFRTISEIARKRIELAGEAMASTMTSQALDLGFRAYSLAETSFTKWQVTSEANVTAVEQHLLDLRDSADDDATQESLLTELLLKQGYSLTEQIGDVEVDGLTFKSVGGGLVLAYLNEQTKPTLQQLRAVLDSEDLAKFIILDDAFKGDDELKTNLVQEAKSRNIELWTA